MRNDIIQVLYLGLMIITRILQGVFCILLIPLILISIIGGNRMTNIRNLIHKDFGKRD